MLLYSTTLLIEGFVIQYDVYKEGDRLFFKPLKFIDGVTIVIFWMTKIDGIWQLMNIEDKELLKQVRDDIFKHGIS